MFVTSNNPKRMLKFAHKSGLIHSRSHTLKQRGKRKTLALNKESFLKFLFSERSHRRPAVVENSWKHVRSARDVRFKFFWPDTGMFCMKMNVPCHNNTEWWRQGELWRCYLVGLYKNLAAFLFNTFFFIIMGTQQHISIAATINKPRSCVERRMLFLYREWKVYSKTALGCEGFCVHLM